MVDYHTGKLKHRFLHVAEKESRGAAGQHGCFAEAPASVYRKEKEITPANVIELLKKFHIKDEVEEDSEMDEDLLIRPTGFDTL